MGILVASVAALAALSSASAPARPVPPARLNIPSRAAIETAYFAGGCFWGIEGVFEHVRGVRQAVSGYAGGSASRPSYRAVSGGGTGHAETVRVTFDPRVVSYAELMRIFFSVGADPTTRNYQGPDHGPQYRTALFPVTPAQARQARAYIGQLQAAHVFPRPIVTTIEPLRSFTPAEAEHQDFMRRNPLHPYIVANDRPKVAALKRDFPQRYR
jgi:peptide-methionine (S)-S-oxide reductase